MNKILEKCSRGYRRLTEWYVGLSWSHPWKVLGFFGLVTVFMAVMGSRIGISTDLRVLLPSSTPSVQALEESEARLGATDFFTLAFEDSSVEKVGQFQKAVAESLSKWDKAKWVQYDEDRRFFERHALLYLPEDQLLELEARLHSIEKKASGDWDPLVVDLESDAPPAPASLEGWPDKMALYKQGMPMDVVDALLERINKETGDQGNAVTLDKPGASAGQAAEVVDPTLPDSLRDRMIGWHQAKGKWVGVIIAQLGEPSTDARFAQEAKDKGEACAAAAKKDLGWDIHTAVVGAYSDPSSEIAEINGDMWVASTVAITLILSLLLYYMRRPGNVLVVFLPLLVAMVWMMGSAEIIYGRLTVLTSFVLALLSGLGIEYSIHVYSRWMEERRKGHQVRKAMEITLQRTGRSLFSAMLASVTCMIALQVGHFQGFKEFGIVVSMGIMEAFIASLTLVPPILFLMLRLGSTLEAKHLRWLSWIAPSEKEIKGAVLVPLMSWPRWLMGASFSAVLAITVFLMLGPSVQFENDFANLRSGGGKFKWLSDRIERLFQDEEAIAKANQTRISYGRAVGKGKNTSPSVVMAETEEQMREVHDTLGARFGTPTDTMLKSFVTIQSFVPRAGEQLERLEVIHRVRETLDGPGFAKLDSSARARVRSLRQYTECDTFGFDSLPQYAQRFMTEKDGTHGRYGMIYADMRESDAIESKKFQDRFSHFTTRTGDVRVASTGFIYADVVEMVKSDVGRLAFFVFAFLAIVVWLDTRSWRGLLVNMGYIGLISFWTYGAMGWLGLKLGMFNIVVVPALLSNTVDATIHLFHRRMEAGAGKMGEVMHTAGSSVLAGTLTNAFGFLSLIVVSHRGLNTIGMLACLGYIAGITIMFAAMPYFMEIVCPKEPQHGHEED